MEPLAIDSGGHELVFRRATLRMWQPSARVFVCHMSGHVPGDVMPPLLDGWNRVILDPAGALIFADCARMTGYDPVCRTESVKFFIAHRSRIEHFRILIGSKIAAMGVSVVNLAIAGMVEAYTDPAKFARELDAVTGSKLPSSQVLSRT